jgi:hypothetical protein
MSLKLARHNLKTIAYLLIIVTTLIPATIIRHTGTHPNISHCQLYTTIPRLTTEYYQLYIPYYQHRYTVPSSNIGT